MASFEETRYFSVLYRVRAPPRGTVLCLAPPCISQVKPPLGKSDIFDAWPLQHKGKRGRGD